MAQVVAYATRVRSSDAVPVYPQAIAEPQTFIVSRIRVGTAGFALDVPVADAGSGKEPEPGWRVEGRRSAVAWMRAVGS